MNAQDLVKVGNTVVIKEYCMNWVYDMDAYIGKPVVITRVFDTSSPECNGIKISADGGKWNWGYEMIDVPATLALTAHKTTTGGKTMDFSKLKVGDKVVLKQSEENWTHDMINYVGKTVEIKIIGSLSTRTGLKFKDTPWNWGTSHIDVEKTLALVNPKSLVKDGFSGLDNDGHRRFFLPSNNGVYSRTGSKACNFDDYDAELNSGVNTRYSIQTLFDTDGNLVWERPNPNAKEIEKLEKDIEKYEAEQRKYSEKKETARRQIKALKGGK